MTDPEQPTNDPKCPGCGFLLSEHREDPKAINLRTGKEMGPGFYVCPKPKRKRGHHG